MSKNKKPDKIRRLTQSLASFWILAMLCLVLPIMASATETSVSSLATLLAAYPADSNNVIDLKGDTVTVTGVIQLDNTTYTIENGTLLRGKASIFLLETNNGGKLTLENVTIDGNKSVYNATRALIRTRSGTDVITINSGTALQNNKLTTKTTSGAGAIYNPFGTVVMNGGTICNNEAAGPGGAVTVGYSTNVPPRAYFTMNGGSIINNQAGTYGGGIYFGGDISGGTDSFTMNGGTIKDNTAGTAGSAIYVSHADNIFVFGGAAETEISGSIYLPAGKTLSVTPATDYIVVVDDAVQTPVDGTVTISSVAVNLFIKGSDLPVAATPSITGQPSGAGYVTGDQAAPLSVTASVTDGGTLSYQWYSNTTSSTAGASAIDGATAAAYIPGTDAIGTTYYYCAVTNTLSGTTASTISDIVAVSVGGVKQKCDTIYLDGVYGNDTNLGTSAQDAVKTFGEAKKWLNSDGTIYVCGQVTVADEQTWSLAGLGSARLARYGDFKGTGPGDAQKASIILAANGGRLTLENITIDGAGIDAATAKDLYTYIAKVDSGGTLIMNDGTTLANAPDCSVFVNGGGFVMNGGLITGGYGAAVSNGGAFTMNGGEISGNQSKYYSGGVYTETGGSFTMAGGIITNNSIPSGGNNLEVRGTVVITGGTISDGIVSNGNSGVRFWKVTASDASFTIAPAPGQTVVTDTVFYFPIADFLLPPVITVGAPLTDDLVISVQTPANGYKLVQGAGDYALTQADVARISAANAGSGYSASWDAGGNAVYLLQSDLAVITVGSAEGAPGGAVTVPVSIANNPGFCSFAFSLNFDTDKLELTDITNGNVVGALTATNTTTLPYGLSFVSPSDVTTASGTLFNLHFTVKEGFTGGTCPVSVYCKDNDPDNFCNEAFATVPVNFISGAVTVAGEDPGPLTPPALTADTTDNTVGQAVYLTFTDDEAWRGAISGITVNGSALTAGQYTVNPGSITIDAGVFTAPGDYTVTVAASGYSDAAVTQTVQAPAAAFTIDGTANYTFTLDEIKAMLTGETDLFVGEYGTVTFMKMDLRDLFTQLGITDGSLRAWINTTDSGTLDPPSIVNDILNPGHIYLLAYPKDGQSIGDAASLCIFRNCDQPMFVDNVCGITLTEITPGLDTPPVPTADSTDNQLGQDITLSFPDDVVWRNLISGITVNGSALTTGQYTVNPGSITIDAGVFTAPGDYTVTITATGYSDATVTQTIEAAPAENPKYTVTPAADEAVYEVGETPGGIGAMTVKTGVSGLKYFGAQITPVVEHEGREAVVFIHLRDGVQLSLNVTRADFDLVGQAQAGFNVQAGDMVKVFIMDDLTNDVNHNPILLQ